MACEDSVASAEEIGHPGITPFPGHERRRWGRESIAVTLSNCDALVMAVAHERTTHLDRARGDGVRVLLAEDDPALRRLIATLLLDATGVSMVVEAEDGASAVTGALHTHPHLAVFDNHMPRLSGIDAALELRKLQPALRIALQSSDPAGLRDSAHSLGLPLFDKVRFDELLAWVEEQARAWQAIRRASLDSDVVPLARKVGLRCALCGHETVSRDAPALCPICGAAASWTAPSWSPTAAARAFAG